MAIRDWQGRNDFLGAPRAGGGSLYGGPPPPPAPAPAPAPLIPQGGGGDYWAKRAAIDESLANVSVGGGSDSGGIGSAIKGGLGTVLGGAAQKLDWVANLGLLGAEELSEFISGEEFSTQKNADGTLNEFGKQSNWDKLNDSDYGFGKLFGEVSDNKWINRAVGFVGDVAFDPVTYLGGAVLKSPLAIGKLGRQSMSQTATRLGMRKEVAESISKYGPAYLDDTTRASLGYKKPGVYWGVGDASFKIPGTTTIGRASEKAFAQVRLNTAGKLVGKVGSGRGKAEYAVMRRILSTGVPEDGISVTDAGRFMNAIDDWSSATGKAAEQFKRSSAPFAKWDRRARHSVGLEVQAAPTKMVDAPTASNPLRQRSVIADPSQLSPQAQQLVGVRDEVYEAAEAVGIEIGDLGGNYLPLRMNGEGWDFLNKFPNAGEYREDLTAPTAAAMTRSLRANTVHKFGDVNVVIGDDDSIAGVEAAFQKAFRGKGQKVPGKFFEDDAVSLMDRYIGEMSRNIGVANMYRQAIEDGTIKELIDVSSDEMVVTAANALKNTEFADQLKKLAVERTKELNGHQRDAHRLAKQVGVEMKAGLKAQIKNLGDVNEKLRPQLRGINEALEADEPGRLRTLFDAMKKDALADQEVLVKEIEDLQSTIAGRRLGEQQEAERVFGPEMGRALDDLEGVFSAEASKAVEAEQQLDALEGLLFEKTQVLVEVDRLDEHFGVIFRQAAEMDEILDSPQRLSEFAESLADDGFIAHGSAAADGRAASLGGALEGDLVARVKAMLDREAADAADGQLQIPWTQRSTVPELEERVVGLRAALDESDGSEWAGSGLAPFTGEALASGDEVAAARLYLKRLRGPLDDAEEALRNADRSIGFDNTQRLKELEVNVTEARRAYREALTSYGVDPKRLHGDVLRTGVVLQWDKGYAARRSGGAKRVSWKDALQNQEPQAVRDYAREVFKNDWDAARAAFPEETVGRGGVAKRDFDDLTPQQAARMTGGRVRPARAANVPRGGDSIIGLEKPAKLADGAGDDAVRAYREASELYESQFADRVASVVRRLSVDERAALYGDAAGVWRTENALWSADRVRNQRLLAEADNELAFLRKVREAGEAVSLEGRAARVKSDAYSGALREIDDELEAGEGWYSTLKGQATVEANKVAADEAQVSLLGRQLDSSLAAKQNELNNLQKASEIIGEGVTRQIQAADSAQKTLEMSKTSVAAQQKWATTRAKKLEKVKGGDRLDRLISSGRVDDVTKKTLAGQRRDMDAVFKLATQDSFDPAMMATAKLMDEHAALTTKIGVHKGITNDITALSKRAEKGELALDVEREMFNGWVKLDNAMFPNYRDMAIDAQLDGMLKNWRTAMQEDLSLKWLDEATQIFKSYATMTPGFHARNFMGATFMNFSDGVGVKDTKDGIKHWKRYVADPNYFDNLPPDQQYVADAFNAVMVVGAGGSFGTGELGTGAGRAWQWMRDNRAIRMSKQAGEDFVEGPVRLAAALNTTRRLAKQGVDGPYVSQAAARVKRLHFDYSDLSNFDKKMKRIVPFWTFMSRNLPLQVEQMWRKPKAYAVYNHFMNNFDMSDDDTVMPKYLKDAGAIVLGNSWFGDDTKDFVFAPDLQHNNLMQDIMAFSGEGDEGWPILDGLLASGNPVLARPFEAVVNHSGFRGGPQFYDRERDQYGNYSEKSAQQKLLERGMYVAEGWLPPIGTLQALTGMDVDGGVYGNDKAKDKQLQRNLNVVGFPFKGVGESERDWERRRQQKEDA